MSRLGSLGGRLYRGEISYDFGGRKRRWYTISGAILLVSVVALLVLHLNFSVDFKGGAVFQFSAPAATQTEVSETVAHAGVNGAVVHTTPRSGRTAKTDGIYGIRINHLLEVHVDGLSLAKQ